MRFLAMVPRTYPNGAVGWAPGGPFDCLGPYAKVEHCPIEGTSIKVTAYATGYADTFFSVPACCRVKGRYVKGYFTGRDSGVVFVVLDAYKDRIPGGVHETDG